MTFFHPWLMRWNESTGSGHGVVGASCHIDVPELELGTWNEASPAQSRTRRREPGLPKLFLV